MDTLHKVFRTDERLQPSTISALLGIDLDITDADLVPDAIESRNSISFMQKTRMACMTLFLAGACMVGLMWFMKVGIFHHTTF